jgi:spore coat polysaccharide biosynthesis protein SpsF
MRPVAIVQARLGSTRLPGKVLEPIGGEPMLARVLARAAAIPGIAGVVLATSAEPRDRALVDVARRAGVETFTGSEADVLDRYYQAARQVGAAAVVRITADCPLLDPDVSGRVVRRFADGDVDYVSNCPDGALSFPDGLDTEVFGMAALERAWREATRPSDREHVTTFIRRHPERFRLAAIVDGVDRSGLRWTVDDERDLALVRELYDRLLPAHGPLFGMADVLALVGREPGLGELNRRTPRNQGYHASRAADGDHRPTT